MKWLLEIISKYELFVALFNLVLNYTADHLFALSFCFKQERNDAFYMRS